MWFVLSAWLGVVLVWVLATALSARQEVRALPRKDMFVCDKHGPMAPEATYKLFGGEALDVQMGKVVERKPILTCPLCFEENMKRAVELREKGRA